MVRTVVTIARDLKEMKKRVTTLEKKVEELERGLNEIIKMVADIQGLESGKKFELRDVRYDPAAKTLTGTIQERRVKYKRKKT